MSAKGRMVKPCLKSRRDIASMILIALIWFPKYACSCHISLIKNSLSSKIRGSVLFRKWMAPLSTFVFWWPVMMGVGYSAASCMTLVAYIACYRSDDIPVKSDRSSSRASSF